MDATTLTFILSIAGGSMALLAIWLGRHSPPPVSPMPTPTPTPTPDPFATITAQTGVISSWLTMYQNEITALSKRIERIEHEKSALEERADKAETATRTLGDKLIAQCDFTDYILKTLESYDAGAGWAANFRQRDPRNAPKSTGT